MMRISWILLWIPLACQEPPVDIPETWPCESGATDCAQLVLSPDGYPETANAEEVLRTNLTAYGIIGSVVQAKTVLASSHPRSGV